MAALITAADLGIDTGTDQGLFDWLLASLLFGRPAPRRRLQRPAPAGSTAGSTGGHPI
jgi:hypothetical protein